MSTSSANRQETSERSDRIRQLVSEYARQLRAGAKVSVESIVAERAELMPELGEQLEIGCVYLAWDEELAREVAVKVSHPYRDADDKNAELFLAEARTLARLDHPSVVPVYDAGRTPEGSCYVVSKWICGSDLQLRIERQTIPAHEAVRLIISVADALDHAHQHGLFHRDVKPANILLDAAGNPYLGDFGLALSGKRLEEGRSFAGTPAYMSPEQARGESHRVDARSDIFSLGVVLYELLAGVKPFRSDSRTELLQQVLRSEPEPLRQRDPSIHPELERICLKTLSKRAADRYRTARELADDLQHYLELDYGERYLKTSRGDGRSPLVIVSTPPEPPAPKIVPHGLRPFDASDAKTYLSLVPGPRDRAGLPESIGQWKVRIENEDPDDTFPVGVLYGPSGCGKSSLVLAGLIPKLATHVHPLYVERHGRMAATAFALGVDQHLGPHAALSLDGGPAADDALGDAVLCGDHGVAVCNRAGLPVRRIGAGRPDAERADAISGEHCSGLDGDRQRPGGLAVAQERRGTVAADARDPRYQPDRDQDQSRRRTQPGGRPGRRYRSPGDAVSGG